VAAEVFGDADILVANSGNHRYGRDWHDSGGHFCLAIFASHNLTPFWFDGTDMAAMTATGRRLRPPIATQQPNAKSVRASFRIIALR
jgi:hypothetical protein